MGLAPYGRPSFLDHMRKIVRLLPGGGFELDLKFFRHHREDVPYQWPNGSPVFGDLFSPALEDLLGPRRLPADPLADRHRDVAPERRGDGRMPPHTSPAPSHLAVGDRVHRTTASEREVGESAALLHPRSGIPRAVSPVGEDTPADVCRIGSCHRSTTQVRINADRLAHPDALGSAILLGGNMLKKGGRA